MSGTAPTRYRYAPVGAAIALLVCTLAACAPQPAEPEARPSTGSSADKPGAGDAPHIVVDAVAQEALLGHTRVLLEFEEDWEDAGCNGEKIASAEKECLSLGFRAEMLAGAAPQFLEEHEADGNDVRELAPAAEDTASAASAFAQAHCEWSPTAKCAQLSDDLMSTMTDWRIAIERALEA